MVRILYGSLLLGAGVLHFVQERAFVSIVPKFLPFKRFIVQVSGVIEIIFGVMLLLNRGTARLKRVLPYFFVAVFPANVKMAVRPAYFRKKVISKWVTWGRLPLQWVLIKGVKKI